MTEKISSDYASWPYCVVDGCPSKACRALDSTHCFKHTPGNKYVKWMKIDARNCTAIEELVVR